MKKTSGSSSTGLRERSFSMSEDEAEHSSSDVEVFSVSSIASSSVTDESEVLVPSKKIRKCTSNIYQYFTLNSTNGIFKCNYCSRSYQKMKDGSTGNLWNHIRTKHPTLLSSGETAPSIRTTIQGMPGKREVEKFTPEGFRKRLAKVIVKTDEPFSFVANKDWKDLFSYCNPEAKLPGRTAVREDISNLFSSEFENAKAVLNEVPGRVSIIIDCWTSKNQFPFLGVVAQWIDIDWNIKYLMLDLKLMEGSHTGENIAVSTWDVIESFKIGHKIQSITTDNASNMDTFFSAFDRISAEKGIPCNAENMRVRCFAHILNLCCQDALTNVNLETIDLDSTEQSDDPDLGLELSSEKGIISKLRKCVVKIRSSPQRRESFRRQCTAANLDALELILDVKTRWNSTLDMITRAIKLKLALQCITSADRDLKKYTLNDDQWNVLELIVEFLQPFKDITVFLSSEKFPTISYCALMYNTIFNHFEKYEVDSKRGLSGINTKTGEVFPIWLRNSANKAKNKLEKYYPAADSIPYIVGTVLDSRFKLLAFTETMKLVPRVVSMYRKKLVEIWRNKYKPLDLAPIAEDKPRSFLSLQLSNLTKNESTDELEKYLKEKPVSAEALENGALGWWKNHSCDYPALSIMARDFLSACGTGVPVERLFSLGPLLLTNNRLSMNPDTIRECIFLKSWLNFKDKHSDDIFTSSVVEKASGNLS